MKRCMMRKNRRPLSVSMVFMNSMVDLSWDGRFTLKRMDGIKGVINGFSVAQPSVYGMDVK